MFQTRLTAPQRSVFLRKGYKINHYERDNFKVELITEENRMDADDEFSINKIKGNGRQNICVGHKVRSRNTMHTFKSNRLKG